MRKTITTVLVIGIVCLIGIYLFELRFNQPQLQINEGWSSYNSGEFYVEYPPDWENVEAPEHLSGEVSFRSSETKAERNRYLENNEHGAVWTTFLDLYIYTKGSEDSPTPNILDDPNILLGEYKILDKIDVNSLSMYKVLSMGANYPSDTYAVENGSDYFIFLVFPQEDMPEATKQKILNSLRIL